MSILKSFVQNILRLASLLVFGLGLCVHYRVRSPKTGVLILPKLISGTAAPFLALLGILTAVCGILGRQPATAMLSALGALSLANHFQAVVATQPGFERVFGKDWMKKIPAARQRWMLKRRWNWHLPEVPTSRWERDMVFWTIPGSGRRLLCDLWRPPESVQPSGLAYLFFHGSGWHFLDKDFGTRTYFRHLAAQGHVVMDVAYRMCPEVSFPEILGDVYRSIAWMKDNARRLGVNPERIVIGGASAGGHLALLAAYASQQDEWIPAELKSRNLSVRGVTSLYGPTDMAAYYDHAGKFLGHEEKDFAQEKSNKKNLTQTRLNIYPITHHQMMRNLLGGLLDERPEAYRSASPVVYAAQDCPPTLLHYGAHDSTVPTAAAREMYQQLQMAGAPVVFVELPQTEHAFDVAMEIFRLGYLSQGSPAGQVALYDLERFLALLAT